MERQRARRGMVRARGSRGPSRAWPAIVQEFVPGARALDVAFADPSVDRCSVLLQALFGLRAIHGDPIVGSMIHRDLSPQNILFDASGRVRIIDFGFAKEDPRKTKVLTKMGITFGTEGCIAPEQVSDVASVDCRADIFALGKSIAAAIQNRYPAYAQPHQLPEPWRGLCDFRAVGEFGEASTLQHDHLPAAHFRKIPNGSRIISINLHFV